MLPLTGYADKLSVAAGETIEFKISCSSEQPYHASLVRVICGDPNPAGPGIKEQPVSADFAGSYRSRVQAVELGSYGRVEHSPALAGLASFSVAAAIWPTTPQLRRQSIIAKFNPDTLTGFDLFIDDRGGGIALGAGDTSIMLSVDKPLRERVWYYLAANYDAQNGRLSVAQQCLDPQFGVDDQGSASAIVQSGLSTDNSAPLMIAACGNEQITQHYNGKIERPLLSRQAIESSELFAALHGPVNNTPVALPGVVAVWDFARAMSGADIIDIGPNALNGGLVNLPTRAMKGCRWTGREMCWRHAPDDYAAIHFHDDDLYDCGWQTDFSFDVPESLPSGVYAARLRSVDAEDMIPFYVRPPRGRSTAKICVLIPTFTYTVYTNYARGVSSDEYRDRTNAWGARPWTTDSEKGYGLSTYNYHSDGSGIAYSSWLRPAITMRSGFLAYVDRRGSGLRHFPADLHLIDWLHAKGYDYDVITDHDLHADGAQLIAPYSAVLTTTHPEYQSQQTLDALETYTHSGGRLMYLGGNGFYWRVALNPDLPGAVEIRRAEGGIRAWAAEPGEYYHSFDGEYGGLWRRNDRPPQHLVGVGFTSQGPFDGSYYRRVNYDPRYAWVFAGVEGEVVGDFGFSGGGAAGFELDRFDPRLGSPLNSVILATSEQHNPDTFVLVHEDMLTDKLTWSGESAKSLIRADMVYFETADGGAVFAVGSITFCGSLAYNDYDNDVSRVTENVLSRFLSN